MSETEFTLRLPESLLRALRDVAAARDITPGQLVRDAISREVRRGLTRATSPDRAEERRIAMYRARFASDFALATSWGDLQDRLWHKGAELREAGGGLALVTRPGGARMCKASDLGASLQTLSRRFRAPFPGVRSGGGWTICRRNPPVEIDMLIDPDDV
jgi:hypothetical protein